MFTFIFIQQSSEDLNRDNPRIKTRQQSFVWKVMHDIKFTVHIVFICSLMCIALPLSEKGKTSYVNRTVVESVMPRVNQSLLHPILSLTAHASYKLWNKQAGLGDGANKDAFKKDNPALFKALDKSRLLKAIQVRKRARLISHSSNGSACYTGAYIQSL